MKKNMKKITLKKLALAGAVCTLAAPGVAPLAQTASNTMQLYGFLYTGLRHVDNVQGNHLTGLATGPSRWGLRGTEDMGEGLSANFVLESGFDPGTGTSSQGGRLFGRQAFVSLNSARAGSVSLGRQYDVVSAWIAPYTPAGKWNGYMSHIGDNDNLNWSFRINNAVKYTTPSFDGFQAAALFGFGGQPGSTRQNSTRSLGVTYKADGLSLAAGWTQIHDPRAAITDKSWGALFFPSLTPTAPISSLSVTPEKLTIAGIGGDYTSGPFKYALSFTQSKYAQVNLVDGSTSPPTLTGLGDVTYRNIDANITYSFSPSLQSGLAYAYTMGKVDATGFKPRYHQLNFMTNYFLSKRTILQGGWIHQRGANGVQNAYIQFSSGAASSRKRQNQWLAGIFHFF